MGTAAGAAEPEYGFSRVFPDFHPRVKRLVAELGMTLSPVPSGARDNVFAYGGTFMQRDAVTIRGKPVKVFLSDVMRQLVEAHSTDFAAPFESEKLLSTNLRGLMGNLVSDDEFAAVVAYCGVDIEASANASAADYVHKALLFTSARDRQFYVTAGLHGLVRAMLARSGVPVFCNHKLTSCWDVTKDLKELTFAGHAGESPPVVARSVIMTLTREQLVAIEGVTSHRKQYTRHVQAVPIFVAVLTFVDPFWTRLGTFYGRTTTERPIRAVHYLADGKRVAVVCSGVYAAFWADRVEAGVAGVVMGELAADVAAAHHVEVDASATPAPGAAAAAAAAAAEAAGGVGTGAPSGGVARSGSGRGINSGAAAVSNYVYRYYFAGAHVWKTGSEPLTVMRELAAGSRNGIHACGDSFSTHQNWVEGALESADAVVRVFERTGGVGGPPPSGGVSVGGGAATAAASSSGGWARGGLFKRRSAPVPLTGGGGATAAAGGVGGGAATTGGGG